MTWSNMEKYPNRAHAMLTEESGAFTCQLSRTRLLNYSCCPWHPRVSQSHRERVLENLKSLPQHRRTWREGLRRQASFLIIEDNPHVERPPSFSTEVVSYENNSHACRMGQARFIYRRMKL
jgi:hypothetical protein